MRSQVPVKGNPIHAMLFPLPFGFWLFSWFVDLMFLSGWGSGQWQEIAFYSMGAGLIAAIIASVPGYLEYLSLDYHSLMDPHIKKIGTWHFSLNLTIILIFTINLFMRTPDVSWEGGMALSTLGILLLGISGWFEGKMVDRYGEGANLQPILRTAGRRAL